jgi:hypothetical protein
MHSRSEHQQDEIVSPQLITLNLSSNAEQLNSDSNSQSNLELNNNAESQASTHSFSTFNVFPSMAAGSSGGDTPNSNKPSSGFESELQIQRDANWPATSQASTAQQIQSRLGHGSALPNHLREPLESQFEHGFSNVNIHTDQTAHDLSQQVGANAFTTGNDIFFRANAYQPQTSQGLNLLTHELTHVVQQSVGPVEGEETSPGLKISDPADAFEQNAVRMAERVSSSINPTNDQTSQVNARSTPNLTGNQLSVQRSTQPSLTIQRQTPNAASSAPNDLQNRVATLEKQQRATQIDARWRSQFGSRLSGYRQAIWALTAGFQAATSGFTGAHARQAQADAIKDQVFAAILGVGAAGLAEPFLRGALGSLGSKLTNVSSLIETLENPLVAAAQGTANVGAAAQGTSRSQAAPSPTGGGGTGGGGGDPMTFLSQNMQTVEQHTQRIESAFSQRASQLLNPPANYWDTWNETQYEQNYVRLMAQLDEVALSDPGRLEAGPTLAVKIELYFWSEWIKSHPVGVKGLFIQSEIATRMRALGLESLAMVRFDTESWIFMDHTSMHWDDNNALVESHDPQLFENNLRSWAAGWRQRLTR